MTKKLGVVIFNSDYSDEGLAALQWASDSLLSMEPQLVILFVKEDVDGLNEPGETKFSPDHLYAVVADKVGEKKSPASTNWALRFDDYMSKFGTKKVSGISYQGPDIQKMLEGAIKKFKLDTLVLGMAAVRLTTGHIDLQLNSECSVVLAKMDHKPLKLKTTMEISDAPADADNGPVTPVNDVAGTVSTSHPPDDQDQDQNKTKNKTKTKGNKSKKGAQNKTKT